jgi:alpha-methylacyl-CoA racemase
VIKSGPLVGTRIVELAGIGAGPHAAMMLSDLGAEVVCVDRIVGSGLGIAVDPRYDLVRRGRRSIAIDLKKAEGRETILRLIEQADAVIESFRPGVMERLELGPDVCLRRNPRLVYGRMTGWGQDGPYAERAGHDINYIALSGVLHTIGPPDTQPLPPLNLVGDFGGAAYFAFGVVSALLSAAKSGEGQIVDGAMIDGAAALLTMIVGFHRAGLWTDERGKNILDGGAPFYRAYRTSDHKHVAIGAVEPKFYHRFLERIGLADDPEMLVQSDKCLWDAQARKIAGVIAQRTRDDWSTLLEQDDVCFAPVLGLDEVADHPHIKARQVYADFNGVMQPSPAPRFSRTVPASPGPPCVPGDHSRSILAEWKFAANEIDRLIEIGAVAQKP